jgi:hypothetical protein
VYDACESRCLAYDFLPGVGRQNGQNWALDAAAQETRNHDQTSWNRLTSVRFVTITVAIAVAVSVAIPSAGISVNVSVSVTISITATPRVAIAITVTVTVAIPVTGVVVDHLG